MKNSGNILLGILGAAAAGIVIGMIVAPKKGSALRSDLKSSGKDLTKKLSNILSKGREKYNELSSLVDESATHLRRNAKDFANEAGSAYNKAEETYSDFTNDASKIYKKAKS